MNFEELQNSNCQNVGQNDGITDNKEFCFALKI